MMPAPQQTISNRTHPNTDRVRKHKDGSILLSISENRVCKLNGAGAMTWMVLEESPRALTLADIVGTLRRQFESINREGELLYEVSPQQLQTDTTRFLMRMTEMNLLAVSDERGEELYSIKEDVSGTSAAKASTTLRSAPLDEYQSDKSGTDAVSVSKRETVSAFFGLLAFDLLLKIRGFNSLIRRVERWPIAEPKISDREICRRVRGMVDRAQMYYPKKAMCLQHSAVVTCLLRRRGVAAQMVLAAQEFPPKAHAWSEVAGEVVNDRNSVKNEYLILRRL